MIKREGQKEKERERVGNENEWRATRARARVRNEQPADAGLNSIRLLVGRHGGGRGYNGTRITARREIL